MTTLAEARDWLRERVDEGAQCPCCTQFAKVYPRRLTAGIAHVLITMYRHSGRDWVYLPDIRSKGQDEAIARFWGLIEQYPDARREDGSSRIGWWRLTEIGEAFVRNAATVPKRARIYSNRLLDFVDPNEHVTIIDVLGTKFDYRELMNDL